MIQINDIDEIANLRPNRGRLSAQPDLSRPLASTIRIKANRRCGRASF
jgi:hypothetical protein